jgi:hippurate hydrolase
MNAQILRTAALLAASACLSAAAASAQSPRLGELVERELPALVSTYKHLHANPELSHQEEKTAALVARELRALGYEVTENVGRYHRPEWKSYGVVGVLRNGAGPTVLVRADMDALPYDPPRASRRASLTRARSRLWTTTASSSPSCTPAATTRTSPPSSARPSCSPG